MAVIFIPGIKATELLDTTQPGQPPCWPPEAAPAGSMPHDPWALALETELTDDQSRRLQPGQVLAHVSAPLLHALRADLAPQPVHAFAYDWRLPLETTARQLQQTMSEIRARERRAGRPQTISFVTHSMGGLLLRTALALEPDPTAFSGVDRIVFIAPPFRGTLASTAALVVGESDSPAGGPPLRKILRGFPAVYQLTPSWSDAAVNEAGDPVDLFDADNWQLSTRQAQSFRTDFLRQAEVLHRGDAARHSGHDSVSMLSDTTLATAADRILIIGGSGHMTPRTLPVLTNNAPNPGWFDFAHMTHAELGDERVWLGSAAVPGVPLAAFGNCPAHGLLCRDERIIHLTSRWLRRQSARRVTARHAGDAVTRDETVFDAWDGNDATLSTHVADANATAVRTSPP